MSEIRIGWLFPDTLYLHGDRGNVLALERYIKGMGCEPVTDKIDFDTANFDPMDYDILFCPPGELVSFPVILEWLRPYKEKFDAFIDAGRPLIVTGTSTAMWCGKVNRTDGSAFEGMGVLKASAHERTSVYGDDIYCSCRYGGKDMEIIGNQIQMIDLENDGEEAFGRLMYGYGNTGRDREEGFIKGNSIFTNALGPLLALNPWLTAEIVRVTMENRGISPESAPSDMADMELERKSFDTKREFIMTKTTELTNCDR